MGIQSDTEMLSVSAVEEYATQNHIAVDAAYELFHRHQIFEKIILQHEYLHQISMDEVMENGRIVSAFENIQKNIM